MDLGLSASQQEAAVRQNAQYIRLEALKLSRDIAVGNEPAAITLDRARQFHDFLTDQEHFLTYERTPE